MKRCYILILSVLFLSACTLYQPEVQQGNLVKPEMVQHLHKGMNSHQVVQLMGTPVLKNMFADNRMNYVYTFQNTKGEMTQKKPIILTFKNDRLVSIER